ncbi:MAG: phosphate ABC transporter permease PstA [Alphaproteobacteria bacterium]|nr:phosphate ABC transporter permease PstA [Alphaproteobacteria bacterium]
MTEPAALSAPSGPARAGDLAARGEPYLWMLGGALALGVLMVCGFLALVLWNGAAAFWPKPVEALALTDGTRIVGEPTRREIFHPAEGPHAGKAVRRTLYRTGNFDLSGEDYRWVAETEIAATERPGDMVLAERLEWGVFIGRVKAVIADGVPLSSADIRDRQVKAAFAEAERRWRRIHAIERGEIGAINREMERDRLALRKELLASGESSDRYRQLAAQVAARATELAAGHRTLAEESTRLRERDGRDRIVFTDAAGSEKDMPLSAVTRIYHANDLGWSGKSAVYLSRWKEFLTEEPREANTEGGVLPAIFGTFAMTILMVILVTPFGVITALYLREYARQGRVVALVRISVNNLAGVPSIVYGVFGLGFLAYLVGGNIDRLFYPERLPNPTFGTGGMLWASLTLALLTVPVVIVATEEALAAVPRSMREGSLACGASKWQTIRRIVLPRAMPGILTGVILAMARGAGEVAPLMLVGVVKLAPDMPVDGVFPFVHLERSFMHLGFHIFDVGFQSRNAEAGKPMVFVTTLLLIALIAAMNVAAIVIRNRLKRRFAGSQF